MQKKQDLVKPSLSQSEQEAETIVTPTDATVSAKKGIYEFHVCAYVNASCYVMY